MKKLQNFIPLIGLLSAGPLAYAEEQAVQLEKMEIVGVTPLQGSGIGIDKVPVPVQKITAEQLEQSQSLSLADYMNRYLGSVNINDAQNNPFQPDVQFRGYTASPLMGLPQGLSVYMNSIRVNEVFGDTVHWDLIPEGAIDTMTLQSGSNPAFGLNTLGGAIAVKTKTGFSAPGHHLEVSGGSWGRHSEEITSGWNNGEFGVFLNARYFNEDGWRDFSDSEVMQGFAALSWRGAESSLDLTLLSTDNDLKGNGTIPVELLRVRRDAVFTHPDQTINRLFMASLDGATSLNEHIELSGNMYFRRLKTNSLNGDGSEFQECARLVCDEDGAQVLDLAGSTIPWGDNVDGGTYNSSTTIQRSFGFSLQSAFDYKILDRENHFIVGAAYSQGNVHYSADTELGALNAQRGVDGSGIKTEEAHVRLNTETENYSLYFSETFSATDKLNLTVAGRYNQTSVKLLDQAGTELNGYHVFQRFNPSAGLTYVFRPEVSFYGNYSESTRAPTPMELSCSDPDAPCKLPNAFVSDPPLKQVVAHTFETGFRGEFGHFLDGTLNWRAGVFRTENENDILFKSTGGVVANTGYFDNVGKTRHQGIELGIFGDAFDRLRYSANYTYMEATFRTPFKVNSPSHPAADANGDIQVEQGDFIPGIPRQMFKVALDYDVIKGMTYLDRWTMGTDVIYNGSQYLRGDESNQGSKLNAYAVVNLRTEFQFNPHITLFARVTNLFDTQYKNFGQYANTGDVLTDALGISDRDTQFVGIGAPRAGWVGVRLSL
ncbi:TonB-dependent receptor [methane-oxidizing endosymbiont of Gigantopelta aegis]|uniref:TonB-dependent receptor n=1 Tax=methane-oxidizing endosymbiont of Gigantopelta aegis TaxID=2794938 RepID=UPI0018DB7132|nr:TonB-dependent receptor [methane-oxidizing endosymbiont of Gigantopelta aegis]